MAGSGSRTRATTSATGTAAEQREQMGAADGREPPAAAVTWRLSEDYAGELLPAGGTWPLLVLAALLDSHGIPGAVLTAPAACRYLMRHRHLGPEDPRSGAVGTRWPWTAPGSSAQARPS